MLWLKRSSTNRLPLAFKAGCYQELTNPKTDKYADSIAPYDTRVDFKKWEA